MRHVGLEGEAPCFMLEAEGFYLRAGRPEEDHPRRLHGAEKLGFSERKP